MCASAQALRRDNRKAQIRAFVEGPFRIVRCVCGCGKLTIQRTGEAHGAGVHAGEPTPYPHTPRIGCIANAATA